MQVPHVAQMHETCMGDCESLQGALRLQKGRRTLSRWVTCRDGIFRARKM